MPTEGQIGDLYVIAGPPLAMTSELAKALSRNRDWYLMPPTVMRRDAFGGWPAVADLGLKVPWYKPIIIADIIGQPGDALSLFSLANLMGRQLTRVIWILEAREEALRRAGAGRFEEVADAWDKYRLQMLPEMDVLRQYQALSTVPVTSDLDQLVVDALQAIYEMPTSE